MRAHQAELRIATMARVIGVSPSGYCAWRNRERSAREYSDEALSTRVREIHQRVVGDGSTGRAAYSCRAGRTRHASEPKACGSGMAVLLSAEGRQMREAGLAWVSRRKGPRTTRRDPKARPAPDLVERRFDAERPGPTVGGRHHLRPDRGQVRVSVYLRQTTTPPFAVVLDVFSRRVVGWAMADHLRTELALGALDMALGRRRPPSVIHHSDQGCQYTTRWPSASAAGRRRCPVDGLGRGLL